MDADWDKSSVSLDESNTGKSAGSSRNVSNDLGERTAMVSSRLKSIYRKAVLPVEKRFRYDFFHESPFLTEVEFDCKS